jgi:hypothetical protein
MLAGILRWILDHLIWDPGPNARHDFWGALWATRKLLAGIVLSGLLTWMEWVMHHPPEIVIVEVVHFLFVMAAIALVVSIGQWLRRSTDKTSPPRS